MAIIGSKTGNGAYSVETDANDKYVVRIESSHNKVFDNANDAYDWCVEGYERLQGTMRGYAYLNAAHDLQAEIGA